LSLVEFDGERLTLLLLYARQVSNVRTFISPRAGLDSMVIKILFKWN